MPLPTTNISLNAIHVEVGGTSGTTVSLNDADVRGIGAPDSTYAGSDGINTTSGTTISIGEFRNASAILWSVGLTQGQFSAPSYQAQGYSSYIGGGFGSATDTSCDLFSGSTTWGFYDTESSNTNTEFAVSGPTSNSGWTYVKIYSGTSNSGTLLSTTYRTSCSYSNSGSFATWTLLSDHTSSSGNLYLEFY